MGYFDAITQPRQVQLDDGSKQTLPPLHTPMNPGAFHSAGPDPSGIGFNDAGMFKETPGMFKDAPGTFMPDGSKQQMAAQQGARRGGGGGMPAPIIPLEPPQVARRRPASPFRMDMSTPATARTGLGMPSALSFASRVPGAPIDDPLDDF